MKPVIKVIITLLFSAITIAACSSNPYGNPDDQRSRSKDAQDEMRRDTSK